MLHRRKLAEKLIAANSETERKTLLVQNKKQADARLALALKEICYVVWTSEPTKANTPDGADIINISFGYPEKTKLIKDLADFCDDGATED